MTVVDAVSGLGGVARTSELKQAGFSRGSIEHAVEVGRLVRARIGWLVLASVPEHVLRAHQVGGPPACATVAASRGLWMLHEPHLHVEVAQNASRLRAGPDVVLHWTDARSRAPRSGQSLTVALQLMATCLPEVDAVCTIDSALFRRMVSGERLMASATPAAERVFASCDSRAESGTESVFRFRATALGYPFRIQVDVPGGRVDFLFGDRLIVEVDGSEFHSGHDEFVKDRERDAWHAAIGYYVVRLTYAQVVHRWHEVESLLRLLHARGEHLGHARIRNTPKARRAVTTHIGVSTHPS